MAIPVGTHPEFDAEQAYIDRAYARVDELRDAAMAAMNDVLDLGRGGTFQARTERDVVVRNSLYRLEQLDIGNQSLLFGRIDEVEGDYFYVGRLGISSREQEPLVVDWRAPVAEPFYRATGRFPMGLVRRRHFAMSGRRLSAIEDEPLNLTDTDAEALPMQGQGSLLAALERSRSGRMHDIVATIQGEQDEVIRAELPGVLVVQGGPGTGKTAVALHRAAYLLYTHRFPLERQGVLVVGPNPVFLRYIGHVLPSLGETGVTLSTVAGLTPDVHVKRVDSPEVAAVKGDIRMARVIERAIRFRQRALAHDGDVPYGPYLLRITVADSHDIVRNVRRRGGTHNARRKRVERLLTRKLYAQYQAAVERARSVNPSAQDRDFEDFSRSLRHHGAVREALQRMWPILHATELIHDLFGAMPLIRHAAREILSDTEVELVYRPRSESLDSIPWTHGDIALADEARMLLGPTRVLNDDEVFVPTFGHVVVDEAQDLSPMQLRMLGRRSLGGSMTLVGDIAQATGSWAPIHWDDIVQYLPAGWKHREVELTIGYRTPAEAMTLAARVLEATGLALHPPRPVRSAEQAPQFVSISTSQLAKEVAVRVREELDEPGDGTIAVITSPGLIADLAHAFDEAEITYGSTDSRALETPVTLLSAEAAKGLEFDSVFVVEPAAIIRSLRHGLRALYVALTRTTQRLTIMHSEALPEALSS